MHMPMISVKRMMLTLDGSKVGLEGLMPAASLAKAYGAELLVFSSLNLNEVPRAKLGMNEADFVQALQDAKQSLADHLEVARQQLEEEGVPTTVVQVTGRPVVTILEACKEHHIDLLVMASRGRGGLERMLLGSVAEAVVRRAPCPVLIVPAGN